MVEECSKKIKEGTWLLVVEVPTYWVRVPVGTDERTSYRV